MANEIYCLNGHFIGSENASSLARIWADQINDQPSDGEDTTKPFPNYCMDCGSPTIDCCPKCREEITSGGHCPKYCGRCGLPFPWTEQALKAANEYVDELNLSDDERTELKSTFEDLTTETARTPIAFQRFQKAMAKVGPKAADTFKDILAKLFVEYVKHKAGW